MSTMLFAAYPSEPEEIGYAIEEAAKRNSSHIQFRTWKMTFGPGKFIDKNIIPEILKSDGLIVDISVPNENVVFEAGFAIGSRKPIIPIRNVCFRESAGFIKKLGIFDNIGYQDYENGEDLIYKLGQIQMPQPIFEVVTTSYNTKQPVYVLDALRRSEFAAKIISAVKGSIKFFRSFDPQEEYRLSLRTAWEQVAQSSGVIVSLLSEQKEDAELHNLRAAFLAGLSLGMGRDVVILVDGPMETPLDFRDHCKTVKHPDDISTYVDQFGVRALAKLQLYQIAPPKQQKSLIKRVSVGSAAAENEFRDLEDYYIDTPQFRAALEGRGRLVIGRKGSGKTAIFWRVRDTVRNENKNNIVVDLKPDGYQLRKFKEQILKMLTAGTKEHTLTALWEYLIYGELIYKIFESDYSKFYGRDTLLTRRLDALRPYHEQINIGREGDFSERMMGLLDQVWRRFRDKYGENAEECFLTTEQVTELIYEGDIRKIQDETLNYLKEKHRTLILIDNIDKGWGAHGVDSDDIIVVGTLMEALRKVERQAARREVEFDWLLLLRNDVFELLVEEQSDRGKEDKIVVDWDSHAALGQVIERRVSVSTQNHNGHGAAWIDIAEPYIDNVGSLDWLVSRSLMRPRYLIQIVQECLGHAASSGHNKILEQDFREGYRLYSLDIIGNTNYEIRDVFPDANDAIYALIGIRRQTTMREVEDVLKNFGYRDDIISSIIKLFFWFGIFGARTSQGDERYIYDYRYDEKIFNRVRQTHLKGGEPIYINLAFARGLDCQ